MVLADLDMFCSQQWSCTIVNGDRLSLLLYEPFRWGGLEGHVPSGVSGRVRGRLLSLRPPLAHSPLNGHLL